MILYNILKKYKLGLVSQDCSITYHNFWGGQSADEIWFTDFLRERGFFIKYPNIKFAFFSTLGKIEVFSVDKLFFPFTQNRKRIFFTGENVHCQSFVDYKDNMLDYKHIDLSLGFDKINDERYLRFPLWILEMFPADANIDSIKCVCNNLSHQRLQPDRNRFCALVSGNRGANDTGVIIRKQIVEHLNEISKVDCAGKLLRNTEELQNEFNNDKAEFLKQYKFFICPENTSVDGYVTEKVFHSIGSGCIPIYRGSLNNPEPDVLNHDAILFWEKDEDNASLIRKVDELWNNPALYREFYEQPRLQPNAWEVVAHYFDTLEKKLHEICQQR